MTSKNFWIFDRITTLRTDGFILNAVLHLLKRVPKLPKSAFFKLPDQKDKCYGIIIARPNSHTKLLSDKDTVTTY